MPPNAVAQIALTANPNALSTGLNAAYRMVANFAKLSAQVLQSLHLAPKPPKNGSQFSVAKAALGTAVGMYTKRGLDLLVDQGREIFDFNDQLVRFGIAARIGGGQLEWVGRMARQVAGETGIASTEVLRGARAYVDMAGANAFTADKMALLARVAQASKSDIGDLSQVMFQLQRNMKVSDGDLENTFGGVINMSKDGAVHFAQMAAEISELAPQAARYGMTGRDGVNQLTALMQVARTGFGSVSEMGTGITRVFAGLTMHADKFEHYGVKIFDVAKDGTKHWRHFSDIFNDIRKNDILSKDPFLLRKAFGRSEADRTIRLWMEGVKTLKELEDSGRANGVVQADLATYTESAAGRMAIAMQRMKNAVADAFTPERIEKFVNAVEGLADKLGTVAEIVGKVGDVLGGLYGAGKSLRGWLQADSVMKTSTEHEIDDYASTHHVTKRQAAEALQGQYTEAREFRHQIKDLMPDDKTTKESNLLAVRAFRNSESGSDLRVAAESYINEAKLTRKQIDDLTREAIQQEIGEAFRTHTGESKADFNDQSAQSFAKLVGAELWNQAGAARGFSLAPGAPDAYQAEIDRKNAINEGLARLVDGIKGFVPTIHLDGNAVGKGVQDSTDARRR